MPVDRNPNMRARRNRPARQRAPAGARNMSRKESGGQTARPGGVASTPSMGTSRRGTKGGAWSGPTPGTPGSPPSD